MTYRVRASRFVGLLLALLSVGGLTLSGCDSEPTAPQDTLTVTAADAAGQAGYLAWAMSQIGPHFLQNPAGGVHVGKREPADVLVFSGAVTGSAEITFTDAGNAVTTWDQAAHGRLFTATDAPLLFLPFGPGGAELAFGLDISADIDHAGNTATVHGSGTLRSDSLTAAFTLAAFQVALTGYPSGGTLTVNLGGHEAVVTFDGDDTASCQVGGLAFSVSLVTGVATPAN